MPHDNQQKWTMLLAQLPSAPSSARVALWRRLRAVGATGMINGAWVLPQSDEHAALFQQLAKTTRDQGGHATVFNVTTADGEDQAIVERFRADRSREYAEFATRSEGLLEEIDKETRLQKFTFAELEEIEDDLAKLAAWLTKITTRDFFPNEQVDSARRMLRRCGQAQIQFAERVYAHEGLEADDENNP